MHLNGDIIVWICHRQSRRCSRLERNRGKYSRGQHTEPICSGTLAAIVQLAIFEAVNSITRQYQPYLGAITAAPGALPDAAAIEAVYQVLSTYFPASQPTLYADCAERGLISQPEDGSPPRATTSSNYGPWYMIGEPARASNLLFKSL